MNKISWAMVLIGVVGVVLRAGPPEDAVSPAGLAELRLPAVDLRNTKGKLIFSVFSAEKGFPSDPAHAVAWAEMPADTPHPVCVVRLPPGRYSASVLHDENANDKMDAGLFGIPKEGYGVTNNPKPKRRAATFAEGQFDLPADGTALPISLQYKFF